MKKIIASLVAGFILSTSPAYADRKPVDEGGDTSSCVVYPEFLLINPGQDRRKTERILDSRGHKVGRHETEVIDSLFADVHHAALAYREVRRFAECGSTKFVLVEFSTRSNNTVTAVWE